MPALTTAALLRSVGLDVDGPVRWGANIPSRGAGVFAVEIDTALPEAPIDPGAVRTWLDGVPNLTLDGERPTEGKLAARLASFWLPGQTLLYVGRTSKSLGARVAALYATQLGYRRPHAGGHWLKTLREPSRLLLWWAQTDADEEYEDAVLTAFTASLPDDLREARDGSGPLLPWANLGSATSGMRDTGLAAALLDADATPARSSGVRRSDRSATPQRRSPAARASGPRATTSRARTPASKAATTREQPTPVTAEGLAALEAELEHLTEVERPQVVERVKHARELGDLRENADYEAARREQSFLEGRIQQLEQRLRTAVVIESKASGSVAMGSTVRFEIGGEPGEVTIVGSTEADPAAGRISAASPVGKALLGHRAGDEVVVRTPAAEMRYRVLEVS